MKTFEKTKADREIEECLQRHLSFSMIAGAGSGKTTSLVTALDYLRTTEGHRLRRDDKQVACITYTNRAVDVIAGRLQWDPVVMVSTLHSFLWSIIQRMTPNIRAALREYRIPELIEKKKQDDNGGQSQKAIAARARIDSLESDLQTLDTVASFSYNDSNYSDYPEGALGHDDIVAVSTWLIINNTVLRRIVGQKYPYIFVDEAQDTFDSVVQALNTICATDGLPIVGYFGDPMQQIYDKRAGDFRGPQGAVEITKNENYRCSKSVIRLLNAFRSDVEQYAAGKNAEIEGSVSLMLVEAEEPELPRKRYSDGQLERAIVRFGEAMEAMGWHGNEDAKQLYLARQMIARRLGFSGLQNLFTGQYASSKAKDDYESASHFLLMPFINTIYPLISSYRAGDEKDVLQLLRHSSPAFRFDGTNAETPLREMQKLARNILKELLEKWEAASLREILTFCREASICRLSDRLCAHLDRDKRQEEYRSDEHSTEKGDWLADEFLDMPSNEIGAFVEFVQENTVYSTQHGVKGEQYKDVLVIFDDVEAAWNNYSFTKLLTPNTFGAPTDGQKERSHKLAYVCFSRAEENLRIVLFTRDPNASKVELIGSGLFEAAQISVL